MECVTKRVPILLSRGMARLVVVDSIAAPFRCEFHLQASAVRAKHLHSLGAALQRLSSTFRSPVLCINQVGAAGRGERAAPEHGESKRLGRREDLRWLTLTCFFQVTEMMEDQESAG